VPKNDSITSIETKNRYNPNPNVKSAFVTPVPPTYPLITLPSSSNDAIVGPVNMEGPYSKLLDEPVSYMYCNPFDFLDFLYGSIIWLPHVWYKTLHRTCLLPALSPGSPLTLSNNSHLQPLALTRYHTAPCHPVRCQFQNSTDCSCKTYQLHGLRLLFHWRCLLFMMECLTSSIQYLLSMHSVTLWYEPLLHFSWKLTFTIVISFC